MQAQNPDWYTPGQNLYMAYPGEGPKDILTLNEPADAGGRNSPQNSIVKNKG